MKRKRRRLKKSVKRVLSFILVGLLIFLVCYLIFNMLGEDTKEKIKDVLPIVTTTTKPLPNIEIEKDKIYLLKDQEYSVFIDDDRVEYKSSDTNVVSVENGIVKYVSNGSAVVTVSVGDKSDSLTVIATDLITEPTLNNNKKALACKQYSNEEAKLLDELLAYRISEAGLNTRAGAVAAARFLVLEFKYQIKYFFENGRLLTNDTRPYVDGEGRYYHKGLYLSTDKYKDIKASMHGPQMWGCNMYSRITKATSPNGLDCSGYVSWALLNAGFDVGDAGAGVNVNKKNDLDDLGEKLSINKDNLAKKRVKVGDLVSAYGHIGILIGMDDKHYYIAESLEKDIHVLKMTESELIKSDWKWFVLMDDVYKEDGNLTNMWK